VLLDVHDEGAGFRSDAGRRSSVTGGHGLPSMAERLRLAGGTLSVESEPGAGCVVSAAVPG
jgi:signal transduction histidine kinase